jgi:hypothetical protein
MKDNKNLLAEYAALATQLMVSLAVSTFLGNWMDTHFIHSIPVLVWTLPLIVIILYIIKLIKDTSK